MGSLKKRLLTAGVGLPVVGWFLKTEGGVLVLLCICGILACAECRVSASNKMLDPRPSSHIQGPVVCVPSNQALKAGIIAKIGITKPRTAPIITRPLLDIVTLALLFWTFLYSTIYEIGELTLMMSLFGHLPSSCSLLKHLPGRAVC